MAAASFPASASEAHTLKPYGVVPVCNTQAPKHQFCRTPPIPLLPPNASGAYLHYYISGLLLLKLSDSSSHELEDKLSGNF